MSFDLQKLNQGLVRIASIKNYPTPKRPYVSRRGKGRVFRIGVLHGKELSEKALLRNRRGYINAQMNTVAHAPSLYHWLFHRCGIPFEETQQYVKQRKLKVDDVLVTRMEDLESQLDWNTFEKLDIQVYSSIQALQVAQSSQKRGAAASPLEVAWVPALQRALHRTYFFMFMHPGVSISSEEANPKSFVHRFATVTTPETALGLNILRPIGFMDGMRGLCLVSNDVSMIRHWNNEFLGNYGVYDIRFARGTPSEVVQRAAADIEKALVVIRSQLPREIEVPCSSSIGKAPPEKRDTVASLYAPSVALHEDRILVSTPLLPYRIAQRLRRTGAYITMIRSGPFVLHSDITKRDSGHMRPLTTSEMALLFTFERRLKTNRMLMSLKEFDFDKDTV